MCASVVVGGLTWMSGRTMWKCDPLPRICLWPPLPRNLVVSFHCHGRNLHVTSLASVTASASSYAARRSENDAGGHVRVRFAPSPTGNLHVGGARTALFNYLFARSKGGRFVLRIENTDLERSTRESEESMLQDLSWLGLKWDEGPDVGGDYGPYRQSERNSLYKEYADKLLGSGHVYRCFCSNEELEKMKEAGKQEQQLPSKWSGATVEEIESELEKGTPYAYRFRVPSDGILKINDLIRDEVRWRLNTLGDFIIMRSNGQPVYNFCVTVDDAMMAITHVIRAEEHLTNTLRQALLYEALGFAMPRFAHVPLILAPDRSKLSKRDGATSVQQFREMGYLPEAMVNYLALLGWGDGTGSEFYSVDQLVEKFSLGRVNRGGAVFDAAKLRWMNGRYLKRLPPQQLSILIGNSWKEAGILTQSNAPFVQEAVELLRGGIDSVMGSDTALSEFLSYPLHDTLSSAEGKSLIEEGHLQRVTTALLLNAGLADSLKQGLLGWRAWVEDFGKSLNLKGRSLFVPLRLLLTGKLHGPDLGATMMLLDGAGRCGIIAHHVGFLNIQERLEMLKHLDWISMNSPPGQQIARD